MEYVNEYRIKKSNALSEGIRSDSYGKSVWNVGITIWGISERVQKIYINNAAAYRKRSLDEIENTDK
mgnify:CR=1 FL=1